MDMEDFMRHMMGRDDDEEEDDKEKYETWTERVTKETEERNTKMKGSGGVLRAGQVCKIYAGTHPAKRIENMNLGRRIGPGFGVLLTKIMNGKEAELWIVRFWDHKLDTFLPGGFDYSSYATTICMVHADHIVKDLNDPTEGNKPLYEKMRSEVLGDIDEKTLQSLGRFIMINNGITNHSIDYWLDILKPVFALKKQMEFLEMMGLKNK